jgi:hypothetical protein
MNSSSNQTTHVFNVKTDLLNEGKKLANNIYEQSIDTINDVEDSVKEYSEN